MLDPKQELGFDFIKTERLWAGNRVALRGDCAHDFWRGEPGKEIGMAIGFQRPLCAKPVMAGWAAAMIACFAIGSAQAQQIVNPPPPPPPPTFNPSSPSTVPQTPEAPVSPALPSAAGALPPSNSSSSLPPGAVAPEGNIAPAETKAGAARSHARRHVHVRHRWTRRRGSGYTVREVGPSYYPGVGLIYPQYAGACRFIRVWPEGYYAIDGRPLVFGGVCAQGPYPGGEF
jgi:hypothetical protein